MKAADRRRCSGAIPSGLWIGTFHSPLGPAAAARGRAAGVHAASSRSSTKTTGSALIKRLMESGRSLAQAVPAPRGAGGHLRRAKNRMQSARARSRRRRGFDRAGPGRRRAHGRRWPRALRRQNAMDFDDLMLHPLTLFREHPDRLAYWRERFRFVLVDEFQDTNRAQYELIRAAGRARQRLRRRRRRPVDLRLARRRRAEHARLPAGFRRCRARPAGGELPLHPGRSSTPPTRVIAKNTGRLGRRCDPRGSGGEPVTVRRRGRRARRGRVDRAGAGASGARRATGRSRTWRCSIAPTRSRAHSRRRSAGPGRRTGWSARSASTTGARSRTCWPTSGSSRIPRTTRRSSARSRCRGAGIGETSLAHFREVADQLGQAAARRRPDRRPDHRAPPQRARGLQRVRRAARRARGRRARDAGAGGDARGADPRPSTTSTVLLAEGPEGADRWENVRELVAGAAELVRGGRTRTRPARRSSASWPKPRCVSAARQRAQATSDGVTLMTLHTAKGLEWPVVVLAGLEDGLFPLARADGEPGRARGGAPALLRRPHPRQGQAVSHLGPRAAPRRASSGPASPRGSSSRIPARAARRAAAPPRSGRRRAAPRAAWLARPWEVDARRPAAPRRPGSYADADEERRTRTRRATSRASGCATAGSAAGTIQGLAGAGKDLKVTRRLRRRGGRASSSCWSPMPASSATWERGMSDLARGRAARRAARRARGRRRTSCRRSPRSSTGIVGYVAQLDRGPGRPGRRRAASRSARERCRSATTWCAPSRSRGRSGRARAGIRGRLLRGAAATARWRRRERAPARRAAVARAPRGARMRRTQRHAGLVGGSARRRGRPGGRAARRRARSHGMPVAIKDNIVTTELPDHLRLADPRGLRLALRRHGRRAAARGGRA